MVPVYTWVKYIHSHKAVGHCLRPNRIRYGAERPIVMRDTRGMRWQKSAGSFDIPPICRAHNLSFCC